MRGRILGAGLGALFAACFDKPQRPDHGAVAHGDGLATACIEQVFQTFTGSGSGSTACGSGMANGMIGPLLDSNGALQIGTENVIGSSSCTWNPFSFIHGVGFAARKLITASGDTTFMSIHDTV